MCISAHANNNCIAGLMMTFGISKRLKMAAASSDCCIHGDELFASSVSVARRALHSLANTSLTFRQCDQADYLILCYHWAE